MDIDLSKQRTAKWGKAICPALVMLFYDDFPVAGFLFILTKKKIKPKKLTFCKCILSFSGSENILNRLYCSSPNQDSNLQSVRYHTGTAHSGSTTGITRIQCWVFNFKVLMLMAIKFKCNCSRIITAPNQLIFLCYYTRAFLASISVFSEGATSANRETAPVIRIVASLSSNLPTEGLVNTTTK